MAKAFPLAALLLVASLGCNQEKKTSEPVATEPSKPALTKLEIEDVKEGTGKTVEKGDLLYMLYTGKFANDTVFDSTEKRADKPFVFTIGQGEVIKGWDEGMIGMKVGGKRNLGIPWEKAYGEQGNPPTMPPKSDLYFEVELLDIVKQDEANLIERETVQEGTGRAAKRGDTVTVKYIGKLVGGETFDEKHREKPLTFRLGGVDVREFFSTAVEGMKKGGKRKVRIPPEMGFGMMGGPNVGPNEILYYEVELVDLK